MHVCVCARLYCDSLNPQAEGLSFIAAGAGLRTVLIHRTCCTGACLICSFAIATGWIWWDLAAVFPQCLFWILGCPVSLKIVRWIIFGIALGHHWHIFGGIEKGSLWIQRLLFSCLPNRSVQHWQGNESHAQSWGSIIEICVSFSEVDISIAILQIQWLNFITRSLSQSINQLLASLWW